MESEIEKTILMPFCVHNESEETYHARSKSGEYLSSHMLAVFRKMPYKYKKMISGEYFEPEKDEYIFGSAAHKLILEGQNAFNETYIVSDGPINERTGKPYQKNTITYQQWQESQTGEIITTSEFDEIRKMQKSIKEHPEISKFLRPEYGKAEAVVLGEMEGVNCQIRMDFFDPQIGIIDLKTCRDIDFFDYDMRNFGYIFNMAFYRKLMKIKTGVEYPVYMIAVDKTEFHVSGIWHIPPAELDIAERINDAAIKRLKECRETGNYPTGYEKLQIYTFNKN